MEQQEVEVDVHFLDLRTPGTRADILMDELYRIAPSYNYNQKEEVQGMIDEAFIDLVDQIWDDPMDVYLVAQVHELKAIAKKLNLEVNAV